MLDMERQILEKFAWIIPKLSEEDKSYLMGLGDGMSIKTEKQEELKRDGAGQEGSGMVCEGKG